MYTRITCLKKYKEKTIDIYFYIDFVYYLFVCVCETFPILEVIA